MAPGKFKKSAVMRKASMTPEEIQLRAVRARRRFKALVWLVMGNRGWLEDVGDEQLGDNVLKNVKLLTRKKGIKSLLTKQEKSILNKAAEDRTEAEKVHLNRVIGGLKCFRRYPPHVKSQLAAVTYFFYYGPGRVVIKQDHPAYALYFILSGEVAVSQESYDPIFNEMVIQNIGVMVAGEMFGEVSLLHNIPRTATITTITPCEFLCLRKADFDIVLKESVMGEWDKVIAAMQRFRYFDKWDEVAQRECCIRSKLKSYSPDQTILGDGSGHLNYSYFVLKGHCVLIEQMYVKVVKRNGKKIYELLEIIPAVRETETSSVAERGSGGSKADKKIVSIKDEDRDTKGKETPHRVDSETATQIDDNPSSSTIIPSNVEVHIMQCCFFHETAVFNLGENLKRRRIVAVTPLECMLIPRYWIYQRNIGNVWSKVVQYLNTHIPTTKQLFKEFLAQIRWDAYKNRLVNDILKERPVYTGNSIHNVPYSIRLRDDLNFDYSKRNK